MGKFGAIPYVRWRDGRPRFDPSRGARVLGFLGKDLRHAPTGYWYTQEEALAFSRDIALRISEARGQGRIPQRIPGPFRKPKPGQRITKNGPKFVYFLLSGGLIKIGFSRNPMSRALSLGTGLSHGVQSFCLVEGTEHEERQLHQLLKPHRQRGEWFSAHEEVLNVVFRSIRFGRVTFPENKISSKSRSKDLEPPKQCDTQSEKQNVSDFNSIDVSEV